MKKRILPYAILSVIFLGLSFWKEQANTKENNLRNYATLIQQTLASHEEQVATIMNTFMAHPEYLERSDRFPSAVGPENVENLANKPFTLLLFKDAKLVSWSNNRAMAAVDIPEGFKLLDEGFFEILRQDLPNGFSCVALIPIKWHYKISNDEYLKNQFVASENIPDLVEISDKNTPFEITSKRGKSIFIDAKNNADNAQSQSELFILVIIGLFFLCFTLSRIARSMNVSKGAEKGILFFLLAWIVVKILVTYYDFNAHFSLLPLFEYIIREKSILSTSSGDILINIILLLWLIVFFYRDVKPLQLDILSFRAKIILNLAFYATMILGLLMIIYFHKGLINNTKEDFDFENIFFIKFSGLVTVLSLLMLWIVLFLFNYRIMTNAKRLALPFPYRIGCLVVTTALLSPLIMQYNFDIAYPILFILIFIYITLNDYFIDNRTDSELVWVMVWLITFSSISSILLYKYRREADLNELVNSIHKLSYGKDTKALEHVNQLVDTYTNEKDTLKTQESVLKNITQIFYNDNYLSDNYRFVLSDSLIKATSSKARAILDADGNTVYTAQIPIDSSNYYRFEVYKQEKNNPFSYSGNTTVWSAPYLNIKHFDKIDYAIFRKNVLMEQKGNWYNKIDDIERIPKLNAIEQIAWTWNYSEVAGQFDNDTVVVARHKYDGKHKIVFLFAYLFVCLAGISFFFAILNKYTNTIGGFIVFKTFTMNFKVHATIIGLVIFACIVIACITFIYSNKATEELHSEQLQQKLEAVTAHIQSIISQSESDSIDFQTLIRPITSTHQVNVNFYNPTGILITDSDDIVFKKHLKAPLINSIAFDDLMHKGNFMVKLSDRIGDFIYQSGFARIEKNNKLLALLEVPNYSREQLKQNDLSDLMGMLITVYVLLLIPTIMFAYSTAKIIMKPLQEVGEKLREVEFGVKPTKIEWNSKDELGDLINEYNAMLTKLDESAKQIKENAQESAWRMMAKQVCHDIRNPLTPMNLGVQMLASMSQYADLEQLKTYIGKVTHSLEEQIKHLDGLATRFGEYAGDLTQNGSPKLVLEEVNFNEFVQLNAALFENNQHPNTKVNIVMPKDQIFVQIDRMQMTRVVHNLVKNAIEAIPDHREGRVDVFMYEVDANKVQVRISDNGVGVPQEQMTKIFQPNFTTKGTGSGIGLAVSNRIVKDVNGKLWCESVLNQGSDFFIELPILYKV